MNKVYSKKELNAKALEVFEQYPSEDKIFAREDGNIFFNENWADLGRGKLKVYPIDRSDIIKTEKAVEDIDVKDPVIETKKVETPKVETPAADAKKVETPKVETPAANAKKVETLKVDKTLGKDGKNPETRNSNKSE